MDSENSTRRSLRERPSKQLPARKAREKIDEGNFFDTDYHPRYQEHKRKQRKPASGKQPYDEYGHIRHSGLDVCDCMTADDCPGCFYECLKCGSRKCGIQCRVLRKFFYESVSFDGKDLNIKNPHFGKRTSW